jgi:hypothetical protein
MRKAGLLFSTLLFLLFMSGCGSQNQSSTPPPTQNLSQASVGLSLTDSPPSGVTVLFFQLSITGATLTNSSGGTVSLLSSTNPIPVNVSDLLTDSAFLGNQSVAAGTYTGLSLTFANPQLTIFNDSDTALSSTCAVGKVCQLTPTISPLTLSFTTAPFPVTLSASSPLAFLLDVHLDKVIQSDLTVNLAATNGVTISQVSPPQPGGPIPHVGKMTGTVQSLGTNQFTVQTIEGRSFAIAVNSSTTYSYPSSVCSTDNFACVQTGQVVKVDVTLQTDGSLLATAVDYIQLPTQQTVVGNIIGLSTSGGNTVMDLIIQKQPSSTNASALPVGKHAKVTVPTTGVTYAVDSGTFVIPSGLTFAGSTNLQVGQTVLVVVAGNVTNTSGSGGSNSGPVGPPDVTFTASSITLEPSQITGTVASVPATGSLDFTLATMPGYFVPPSPSANPGGPPPWAPLIITVDTTGSTTFTNFTTNTLAGLAVNDVISLHCWVFATPTGATNITVAADAIVDRPGPTPSF